MPETQIGLVVLMVCLTQTGTLSTMRPNNVNSKEENDTSHAVTETINKRDIAVALKFTTQKTDDVDTNHVCVSMSKCLSDPNLVRSCLHHTIVVFPILY